jgi:hypothetical protein
MRVTYDHESNVLEIHWSTEPGEWRRARSNIDLLVNEANETTGIAISAASWLVPELDGVHVDLDANLTLRSWPGYRAPAPSMLKPTPQQLLGITARNAQPQLPWDLDIPRPSDKPHQRGICHRCGSVATVGNRPRAGGDGWPSASTCRECAQSIAASPKPKVPPVQPHKQPQTISVSPPPSPQRSPNAYSGPRGRADGGLHCSPTYAPTAEQTCAQSAQTAASEPRTKPTESPSHQPDTTWRKPATTAAWSWANATIPDAKPSAAPAAAAKPYHAPAR